MSIELFTEPEESQHLLSPREQIINAQDPILKIFYRAVEIISRKPLPGEYYNYLHEFFYLPGYYGYGEKGSKRYVADGDISREGASLTLSDEDIFVSLWVKYSESFKRDPSTKYTLSSFSVAIQLKGNISDWKLPESSDPLAQTEKINPEYKEIIGERGRFFVKVYFGDEEAKNWTKDWSERKIAIHQNPEIEQGNTSPCWKIPKQNRTNLLRATSFGAEVVKTATRIIDQILGEIDLLAYEKIAARYQVLKKLPFKHTELSDIPIARITLGGNLKVVAQLAPPYRQFPEQLSIIAELSDTNRAALGSLSDRPTAISFCLNQNGEIFREFLQDEGNPFGHKMPSLAIDRSPVRIQKWDPRLRRVSARVVKELCQGPIEETPFYVNPRFII